MNLQEGEKFVNVLLCPVCGGRKFDLKLRCDLGYEQCVCTARCYCCRHEFDIGGLVSAQLRMAHPRGEC